MIYIYRSKYWHLIRKVCVSYSFYIFSFRWIHIQEWQVLTCLVAHIVMVCQVVILCLHHCPYLLQLASIRTLTHPLSLLSMQLLIILQCMGMGTQQLHPWCLLIRPLCIHTIHITIILQLFPCKILIPTQGMYDMPNQD